MNKIALVTGASSGIGKATALILAKNNYDVIITGRRIQNLQKVEAEIKTNYKVNVLALCFDIRNYKDVKKIIGSLDRNWKNIDVLINNAGLAAGLNPIHKGDMHDWEQMIDTNVKGLLYITREVSPGMVERKSGHIINIGSIAGKEVYENGNVYCGTKHAVDALSKGMRIDLLEHNIKVSAIHPGAVDTEFSLVRFRGNTEKAARVYEGFIPLYEQDVAEAVLFCVTRPSHVNINDLLIMPTAQANTTKLLRK
jgi:hypothetical protein